MENTVFDDVTRIRCQHYLGIFSLLVIGDLIVSIPDLCNLTYFLCGSTRNLGTTSD